MARLQYVEKETASSDQEKILAQLTQKSGKIANIWKLWSHSPITLETFMAFYKSVMKGTLDAKLREKVRLEIRELQRRLGITTLYVTHDQAEALAISDRIVS